MGAGDKGHSDVSTSSSFCEVGGRRVQGEAGLQQIHIDSNLDFLKSGRNAFFYIADSKRLTQIVEGQ